MALNSKQTTLIHVAKTQLVLSDEDYRTVLLHEAGVETSRDLDNEGFDAVMERFRTLGFEPSATPPAYGHRAAMATPAQVEGDVPAGIAPPSPASGSVDG